MSIITNLNKKNILSYSVKYIDNNRNESIIHVKDLFNNILKYKDRYIHTDNDGDYFIENIGDTIFIYFEESDSWADWMSNFDFLATTYKNGNETWKCHKGFFRVWKTMKKSIEQKVEDIIISRKKFGNILINQIVCAGYSHGAPICGLCVEDMIYLFSDKYNIKVCGYGFGCPRFTQDKLPESVENRFSTFYPIRIKKDIVTHVPPAILGYSHGNKTLLKITPSKYYNCIDAHRPETHTEELAKLYE